MGLGSFGIWGMGGESTNGGSRADGGVRATFRYLAELGMAFWNVGVGGGVPAVRMILAADERR